MGLLDGLERLINEHGSATILKERIQLLNDRHAKVVDDRDQLRVLAASLEAQLQAAQAEVDEVRRLQKDADQKNQRDALQTLEGGHLTDALARLLVVIADNPQIDTAALAKAADVSLAKATLGAERLAAADLVTVQRYEGFASMGIAPSMDWTATPAGLRRLDGLGLLK